MISAKLASEAVMVALVDAAKITEFNNFILVTLVQLKHPMSGSMEAISLDAFLTQTAMLIKIIISSITLIILEMI